ncbi:MAG: sulfatase-like hydrolase/transferase [Spirochaetia bacterium]
MNRKPNVIFVFGDQWRQQATSYAGDPNVKTPNLDALSRESINFTNVLSGCFTMPVIWKKNYTGMVTTRQRKRVILTHTSAVTQMINPSC